MKSSPKKKQPGDVPITIGDGGTKKRKSRPKLTYMESTGNPWSSWLPVGGGDSKKQFPGATFKVVKVVAMIASVVQPDITFNSEICEVTIDCKIDGTKTRILATTGGGGSGLCIEIMSKKFSHFKLDPLDTTDCTLIGGLAAEHITSVVVTKAGQPVFSADKLKRGNRVEITLRP